MNSNITNEMFHNVTVLKDNMNYDLISYFFSQRVIWFFQGVNDVSAYQLCMQLLYLSNLNSNPIYINLQSPGGSVYACLSIINTISTISAPVYITACGFAASAGSLIVIFGAKGHRYALPYARIMLHQVSIGTDRLAFPDFEISYNETKYLNSVLSDMLFVRMNISREEFDKKIIRDWFLSAEEALAVGIIDKIIPVIEMPPQITPTTPTPPTIINKTIDSSTSTVKKVKSSDNKKTKSSDKPTKNTKK